MTILERIKSTDYIFSLGVQLPPKAMYKILKNENETNILRILYQSNALTDIEIKEFVNDLLKEFRYGEKYFYDLTLASIAVALEDCYTNFADEYISDLSKLSQTELKTSTEIAKICIEKRLASVQNHIRVFCVVPQGIAMPQYTTTVKPYERSISKINNTAYAEA